MKIHGHGAVKQNAKVADILRRLDYFVANQKRKQMIPLLLRWSGTAMKNSVQLEHVKSHPGLDVNNA